MKSFKADGGSSSRRAEAFDTRTSTAPQEFRRGLERLSAPEEMLDMKTSIMAFLLSNDREHLIIFHGEITPTNLTLTNLL